MNCAYYDSPVGLLEIKEADGHIVALSMISPENKKEEQSSSLLTKTKKQLDEYFSGKRFSFDLPLKQSGTSFQQKVWEYLSTIPYGKTVSYKAEAEAVGNAKACRAVGSANGKNNIAIIVPCHRVVNSNNKIGGYAYGLDMKITLLKLEKRFAASTKL